MRNEHENTTYIECVCGSEVVSITHDPEYPEEISMSFFERPGGYSFKWRIRAAWHVLRWGSPYEDMICITADDASKIIAHLQKITGDSNG